MVFGIVLAGNENVDGVFLATLQNRFHRGGGGFFVLSKEMKESVRIGMVATTFSR